VRGDTKLAAALNNRFYGLAPKVPKKVPIQNFSNVITRSFLMPKVPRILFAKRNFRECVRK